MKIRAKITKKNEEEIEAKRKGDGSIFEKIKAKREDKIRESKKPKYESWSEEVNEVALEMAEIFPNSELLEAVEGGSPHIFGWLQDNYRNHEWLLDNYVLDVACHYAKNKLRHKYDIVKIVENIDLYSYECWSRVELTGLTRLDNYPNQPFKNIMMISEEPLDEAIYWLEDSEWYLDGEFVRVNLGRIGGVLIAWLSWNVPVILVAYLPYKNKGLYKAKAEAEKIQKIRVSMEIKLVHTYRTMISALEEKIDEKEREAKQWHKMYSDLKKDYDIAYRKSLAKAEYSNYGTKSVKVNANYALIVACVFLGILSIIGFIL